MELKFTDEQYAEVAQRVCDEHRRINEPILSSAQAGRAAVHASLPLLAPVLLGPATDEEVNAYYRSESKTTMSAVDYVLAARLAKYLPKPVDQAVEAVKKMLACEVRPRSDEEYAASLVAAVRAADRQAK